MTFLENLFLNYIPAFLIFLAVLWYFGALNPLLNAAKKTADTEVVQTTQKTKIADLSAREIVALYAKTFLSADAQARLNDPINATFSGQPDIYETLSESSNDIATPADISDAEWGQLLIEELHEFSVTGVWLDWKFNVLTMMQDDEWDNQLAAVFELNGLPTVTEAERASILDNIDQTIPPRDLGLQIDKLQVFAKNRGYVLLIIHNESDGVLLTTVPMEKATPWIGVAFSHILISDVEH